MLTVIDSGLQTVKLTAKLMLKEIGWEKKMAMRKEKYSHLVIGLVMQMDLQMVKLKRKEIGWVILMERQTD